MQRKVMSRQKTTGMFGIMMPDLLASTARLAVVLENFMWLVLLHSSN
jgi:hypothetical protein